MRVDYDQTKKKKKKRRSTTYVKYNTALTRPHNQPTNQLTNPTDRMPLHLLHHKSYHVYNAANIARVRADEANAAATAALAASAAQSSAASERLELLRARAAGEEGEEGEEGQRWAAKTPAQRKLDGRVDREGIVGADGHINLFPAPKGAAAAVRNEEAEREKKAKEAKWEADTFRNALGKPCNELQPWYSTLPGDGIGETETGSRKREETGSRKREEAGRGRGGGERWKDWDDPLKSVNSGVRQLRDAERERAEWRKSRELDVGGATTTTTTVEMAAEGLRRRESDCHSRRRSRSSSPKRDHRHGSSGKILRSRFRSHLRRSGSCEHRHRHRHHNGDRGARRPTTDNNDNGDNDADDRIAGLRREREEREERERQKTQLLLEREKERTTPGWKPVSGRRYSRQFGID